MNIEREKVITNSSTMNINKLSYRLKNKKKARHFMQKDGKIECPFCGIFAKNVLLHFQRKQECGNKINMEHFVTIHKEYKKENQRNNDRIRAQNYKLKQKKANPEAFKAHHNQEMHQIRDKQKKKKTQKL
jgi:hypothetical protein